MQSFTMNSLFGGLFIFRNKGQRYKVSKSDFYEGKNFLANQSRLLNLTKDLRNTNQISTDKSIRFYGMNFGQTTKDAVQHLGKPNYISRKKSALKNHKILFYRITVCNVNCVLQFHFLKDQFFLGVIEVKNTSTKIHKEITDLVRKKYFVEQEDWVGILKDSENNTLEIKEGMIQRMTYLTGDQTLRNEIQSQIEKIRDLKEKHGQLNHDMILKMI
ncbi:hypothetical protein [uncultured Roseivirga sp.]|uniref:hypothetical protein n=1 Tax=uncultured Roseivirga sp. TaxID=543088 RepID=UPI0030DB2E48|tara:strand:- start:1295 stop:1942 length:648 start_codon:yes stop_codon:yes gene_type:complete